MGDWKEEAIYKYCTLSSTIATYEESIQDDTRIRALVKEEDRILKEINKITESRNHTIEEAKRERDVLTMKLKEEWDIKGKTYKCDAGNATIRITRSLKVDNKETLIGILQKIGKLTQCIKSWDLTYLRKLVDADLFEGSDVIHYDEKKNVVITAAKKESGTDEE